MSASMPWLAGLPDTDVVWDTLPAAIAPASSSPGSSVHSAPGTMRSRIPVATDTVAKRSRSAGPPSNQPSLEWKQRLVHGKVAYGDQTDLFGATGLENIFAKTAHISQTKAQRKPFMAGAAAQPSETGEQEQVSIADDTASSRTLSSDEIAQAEDFTPIVFAKRSIRQVVSEQRKGLDKTETSQRMREAEMAIGEESAASGASDESSVYNAEESSVRHISGFTDAPEVETFELPGDRRFISDRYISDPWAFSELPAGESSELMEIRELRDSQECEVRQPDSQTCPTSLREPLRSLSSNRVVSNRKTPNRKISNRLSSIRQVSFGVNDLDGRTFTPEFPAAIVLMGRTRASPPQIRVQSASEAGTIVSKRPPTSPAKDSTPKRRRMGTPAQGPATGDYINEAKKVIEIIRSNNALNGITEEDEDSNAEDMGTTKKLDNMKTLNPQAVAHLIHGEVKGMMYDKANQCWIRSKSAEYLDPCTALSSDDDPFREISDLTVDRSHQTRPIKNDASEEKTVLHHDLKDKEQYSSPPGHYLSQRYDSPLSAGSPPDVDSPLAGDSVLIAGAPPVEESKQTVNVDDTLANFEKMHPSDPSILDRSASSYCPAQDLFDTLAEFEETRNSDRTFLARLQRSLSSLEETHNSEPASVTELHESLAGIEEAHDSDPSSLAKSSEPSDEIQAQIVFPSPPPRAQLSATLMFSDLPDFTVAEVDSERPSERALATRLASYAALEVTDPYAMASNEVVKALTDAHGDEIHWDGLNSIVVSKKDLKSLHSLDIHCARAEKVDASSNALTQLDGIPHFVRDLNVYSNQLTHITAWTNLVHLQYLNVSGNQLTDLSGLGGLIHLRELLCDDNEIVTLDGLAGLDGLLKLSAKNNRIQSVDFHDYKFGRLEEVDLSYNDMSSLRGLEELPALQSLTLDHNSLESTMQVSKPMRRIEHLSLRSCGLSSLDVSPYPSLRSLFVDENALISIEGLASVTQLDHLSMSMQYIAEDTYVNILEQPLDIGTICLSDNLISTLDFEHVSMGVKHLELSRAGIEALPANFGKKFPNLRSLKLDYNDVSDIRPLAPLRHIQELSLVGCRVDRLRKTVASTKRMKSLRDLDLRENPLTHGFYSPVGSKEDASRWRMGMEVKVRRRVYELLFDNCELVEGFKLDGKVFDGEAAQARDATWEKLVEMGIFD